MPTTPSTKKRARPYRGVSRDERRNERRRRLLDAGVQVIGTNGYQAATVRAICGEAGLTERYFYESFANREALLCAVYGDLIEVLSRRIHAAVVQAPLSPDTRLRAGLTTFFDSIRRDPRVARILLFEILGVSDTVDMLYRRTLLDVARMMQDLTLPALGRQQPDADELEEFDWLATGVLGAVVNIAVRWVLTDFERPLDRVADSALTIAVAIMARMQHGR